MVIVLLVKVLAHIVISSDYPSTRPIVLVKLEHHKFGSLTRLNSPDIKVGTRHIYYIYMSMYCLTW